MAIYVSSGGSGNGSSGGMSAVGMNGNSVVLTLFTTPNVANTMYLIRWYSAMQNQNDATSLSMPDAPLHGVIKAGPNVAVKVMLYNITAANGAALYTYDYVGIIMDTT